MSRGVLSNCVFDPRYRRARLRLLPAVMVFFWLLPLGCGSRVDEQSPPSLAVETSDLVLFDGSSLEGWESTQFGGEGRVRLHDRSVVLEPGEFLTGITWKGDLPVEDYEIRLEAMRVSGNDFFCGLTFPVGSQYCSLILGGWGGGITGLSSIDGLDASENETTQYRSYESNRWYRIRARISRSEVAAWVDDEKILEVGRLGRSFSVRPEVRLSRPLGIAAWQTTAAIRDIRLRRVDVGQ